MKLVVTPARGTEDEKERRRKLRLQLYRAHQGFVSNENPGDVHKLLQAILAWDRAGRTDAFCDLHQLRPKVRGRRCRRAPAAAQQLKEPFRRRKVVGLRLAGAARDRQAAAAADGHREPAPAASRLGRQRAPAVADAPAGAAALAGAGGRLC